MPENYEDGWLESAYEDRYGYPENDFDSNHYDVDDEGYPEDHRNDPGDVDDY